jgi:CRP/FNR family cyclic AMP-dependent transcriptional regulator
MKNEKDLFRSTVFFKNLDDEELDKIMNICKPIDIRAGLEITRENEKSKALYLLKTGEIEVSKPIVLSLSRQAVTEAEKSISRVSADGKSLKFFGEMSLLSDDPRSATVRSMTACSLFQIHHKEFEDLCENNPALGLKVLRGLSLRLVEIIKKSNKDILKLTTALSFSLSK